MWYITSGNAVKLLNYCGIKTYDCVPCWGENKDVQTGLHWWGNYVTINFVKFSFSKNFLITLYEEVRQIPGLGF